jgi:hypothetical protein
MTPAALVRRLPPRLRQMAGLCARGLTNRQIADAMGRQRSLHRQRPVPRLQPRGLRQPREPGAAGVGSRSAPAQPAPQRAPRRRPPPKGETVTNRYEEGAILLIRVRVRKPITGGVEAELVTAEPSVEPIPFVPFDAILRVLPDGEEAVFTPLPDAPRMPALRGGLYVAKPKQPPQGEDDFYCPHCGTNRPAYSFKFNAPALTPVGMVTWVTIVCGAKLGKDSEGGDLLCRRIIAAQILGLQPVELPPAGRRV